ncbi:hypothetical protein HK104_006404 [Borealophlyctis nickersoniae]|nr:hypothetical protein HK104_006404 [Borealophlyctis nickersoniae]
MPNNDKSTDVPPPVLRPLNARELSYLYDPTVSTFAISILIQTPLSALRPHIPNSLHALQETYPLLVAKISPVGKDKYAFVTGDTGVSIPVHYVTAPAKDSDSDSDETRFAADVLQKFSTQDVDVAFDVQTGPLARVTLIEFEGDRTGVIFAFMHAAADGKFGVAVVKTWTQLVSKKDGAKDGHEVAVNVGDIVPASTAIDVIPKEWQSIGGIFKFISALVGLVFWIVWHKPQSLILPEPAFKRSIDPTAPWYASRVPPTSTAHHIHLTPTQTSALIAGCKQLGVSMTSLLCGASAIAVVPFMKPHKTKTDTIPVLEAIAVDGRPYLNLTSHTPGAFNSAVVIKHMINPSTTTLATSAQDTNKMIKSQITAGHAVHGQRFVPTSTVAIPKDFAAAWPPLSFSVSNVGAETYGVGVEAAFMTSSVRPANGACFWVNAITVDGVMGITVNVDRVLVGEEKVEAFTRALREVLGI